MLVKCPSCGGTLTARRLECPGCAISLEGAFELPAILKLTRTQMDFVEVFIKNRGVIRDIERELGVSYPTVRAKLEEVVNALGFAVKGVAAVNADAQAEEDDPVRRAILENLREGRISPEDALRTLRTRASGGEEKSDGGEQRKSDERRR